MYLSHFALREPPFSITPDPRFLYMSARHREALAHLVYGVGEHGGFVQLSGEVGTGKTSVCRCLLEQLPPHVDAALVLNPRLSPVELLAAVCDELRIPYPAGTAGPKELVDRLYRHLLDAHGRGRRTVLIIDEAQNLAPEVLEEVRLLTNLETPREKLLQVVLIGQPELTALLAQPKLRQLAQRITARYHLEPLSRAETRAYVRHRLRVAGRGDPVFAELALRAVYRASRGVPRLINVIADRALLGAYTREQARVDAATVKRAAAEVMGRPARSWRRWGIPAATAVLVAGLGGAGFLLLAPGELGRSERRRDGIAPGSSGQTVASAPPAVSAPAAVSAPPAASEPAAASSPPVTGAPPAASAPPAVSLAPAVSAPPAASEPAAVSSPPVAGAPATASVPPAVSAPSPASAVSPLRALSLRSGPDLSELLREPTLAATKGDALVTLLGLWRADPTGAQLDCEAPSSGAIDCLATAGTWRKLRQLDLPAALELTRSDGERRYGVLGGLTASEATLRFGDRVVTAPLSEVERFWNGGFIVLWRPPPVALPVRLGSRGPGADWLRERLARADGVDPQSERGQPYDDALLRRVVAFQRGHSLKSDGVVGRETAMLLQRFARDADTPRLSAGTP